MRNLVFIAALSALPVLAGAQNTPADRENISQTVPVNMLPPAGKCRIWMIGVAPAQQPAPTDCQTALRQRPTNGVVLFGPVEREPITSQFRGRPNVEQGPEDRPRNSQPTRGTPQEPAREPAAAPARADTRSDTRTPSTESRRRPPSGTARPTEDPTKKPPAEQPSESRS